MEYSCTVTLGSTAWFPKELCTWDVSWLCGKARLLSGLPYGQNVPAAGTFVQNFPLHPLKSWCIPVGIGFKVLFPGFTTQ